MQQTVTAGSPPLAAPNVHVGINPGAEVSARMDRLPITRHLWMLVFLISLGGFFEVYDLIFTGYIAPGMAKTGLLQTTTHSFFGFNGIAAFIAATFAGLFVGTFGFGWMPDRYGRRTVFTFSPLWYSVCSAIMAFQTTPEGVMLWRFITGIGVGIEIITIDSYVTELVPQHMRGRAMAFNQMVMFAAAPVAAILSYWLVPTTLLGIDGWRIVVLAGSLGAVLVWFVRRKVPESPRWLATHGHVEKGERIVAKMEKIVARQSGKPLPPPLAVIEQRAHRRAPFSELLQPPYRSRLIMLIVFNFCQAIGYYGFVNWVPTLLIGQGITVTKSLLYSFIIAFAMPAGPMHRDAVRRQDPAQMADCRRCARSGRLRVGLWTNEGSRAADRDGRPDQPGRADDFRRLPRIPGGTLPNSGALPCKRPRFFDQPHRCDVFGVLHCIPATGLRRRGRLCRHHRLHAGGCYSDWRFWTQDQWCST